MMIPTPLSEYVSRSPMSWDTYSSAMICCTDIIPGGITLPSPPPKPKRICMRHGSLPPPACSGRWVRKHPKILHGYAISACPPHFIVPNVWRCSAPVENFFPHRWNGRYTSSSGGLWGNKKIPVQCCSTIQGNVKIWQAFALN